jgi:RsiW-degrading membrane proteinase PrsW (M82 family)
LLFSIVIEEIAKSIGIYTLIKNHIVSRKLDILKLSVISALGFWAGEKLLLILAAQMSTESGLASVFLGSGISSGWMFFLPLLVHAVSTFVVCTMASHNHKRSYLIGLVCGTVIHALYNLSVLLATGAFR